MFRILVTVATAAIFVGAPSASAQEQGGFYAGVGGGFVFAGNTRSDGVFSSTGSILDGQRLGPRPGKTAKGNFDISPTTSLTVGYDLGKRRFGRVRLEGEVFYQKADTDKYFGQLDGSELDPAGRVDTTVLGVAVNVLYDIGEIAGVRPYFYLGLGQAKIDTKFDFQSRGRTEVDGTNGILQGGFGADIPYNERTTFDLKYRFRRVGLNEAGLDTDIDAQSFEFGIRRKF